MSECIVTREQMPLLLTETLIGEEREQAFLHIESCARCERDWKGMRETWSLLGKDDDRVVPDRVRARFLASLGEAEAAEPEGNVVSFWRRPASRWLAQAAAVVTLVGAAYFAGTETGGKPAMTVQPTVTSAPSSQFTLAANKIVPASELAPVIEGAPSISNIRFSRENTDNEGEVGVSFDLTTNVTVTGSPNEKSFVALMAYLLQDRTNASPAKSDAIQWVRDTYGDVRIADPAIVSALADVIANDSHEGVRLGAIDALRSVQTPGTDGIQIARAALINALKNDPNPAIRIKAIEALSKMLTREGVYDAETIETLRDKASQGDENPYLRIKAAEALSQLNL